MLWPQKERISVKLSKQDIHKSNASRRDQCEGQQWHNHGPLVYTAVIRDCPWLRSPNLPVASLACQIFSQLFVKQTSCSVVDHLMVVLPRKFLTWGVALHRRSDNWRHKTTFVSNTTAVTLWAALVISKIFRLSWMVLEAFLFGMVHNTLLEVVLTSVSEANRFCEQMVRNETMVYPVCLQICLCLGDELSVDQVLWPLLRTHGWPPPHAHPWTFFVLSFYQEMDFHTELPWKLESMICHFFLKLTPESGTTDSWIQRGFC